MIDMIHNLKDNDIKKYKQGLVNEIVTKFPRRELINEKNKQI